MRKIEQNNTLVFIVDARANKSHIKDAVKRMYDVDAAKVNTLIRWVSSRINKFFFMVGSPDGSKKAYVRLTSDVEAMEVANKIGFI